MPRLFDWAVDCSIYLYRSEADARRGERAGGSGFLFGISAELDRQPFIYAVTNWHVASHAPVMRLNTSDDKFDVIPLSATNWFRHPDGETDLAVTPLSFTTPSKYRVLAVGYEHLLTPKMLSEFDVGIGEDLFLVGRFVDRDGIEHNQPTVRFGAIAQMSGNPVETPIGRQDAFLAELRSISGYSGSPVFALIPRHRDKALPMKERLATPVGGVGRKERMLLIGVDCGHMRLLEDEIYDEHHQKTDSWVSVNTGMAIVIGAWKLDELLNIKELKTMREDENRRQRKATSNIKLDYAAPRSRLQKTLAPKEEDRVDIPIPTKGEVMDVFKKATRKREKKN